MSNLPSLSAGISAATVLSLAIFGPAAAAQSAPEDLILATEDPTPATIADPSDVIVPVMGNQAAIAPPPAAQPEFAIAQVAPPEPKPVKPKPVTPKPSTPKPATPTPTPPTDATEQRVVVSELVVEGVTGDLQDVVYQAVQTTPGRAITKTELQADIAAIFATGYFQNVQAVPTDTPLGVRVTFMVEPNPVLKSVQIEGSKVLPPKVVTDSFGDQYGTILNLRQLQDGVKKLGQWYQENGYVLAQVVDSPKIAPDGTVTLSVAEGEIEDIQIKFTTKDGADKDAKGQPIKGYTHDYVIKRELSSKPGDVFNRDRIQKDFQRAYGLGLFEDIRPTLEPGSDPRKVVIVANVTERPSFSLTPSGGYSSASGLFAAGNFQANNLGGHNRKLSGDVQWSQRDLGFNLSLTDPWILGDDYRTSLKVDAFRERSLSRIFDGGDTDVKLPNGDRPRIVRTGGGVNFVRPLSKNVFERSPWVASAGVSYQKVELRDSDGNISPTDSLGNNLSFSGSGKDDLLTIPVGISFDNRNNPLQPTQGSAFRLTSEQTIPIGQSSIFSNKLQGSYSFYVPTNLTQFTPACRDAKTKSDKKSGDCPQTFAFNLKGGTVIGDLPPYEAFSLGGANSVRGFGEGELGTARTFAQASAEYRFPVFSIINGALFVDAATDFGSGKDVLGNPAGVRGKPGSGLTYGAGVRIKSPLGPLRLDYGWNDRGENKLQFGFGERF